MLIVHAYQALGLSREDGRLGLLYAASAVGSLIAAVVLPRASRWLGQGMVSITGLVIFVVALIGLAGASAFTLALAVWAIWAMASLTVNMNGITVRQLLTPDDLQGRVNTTGRHRGRLGHCRYVRPAPNNGNACAVIRRPSVGQM